MGQLEVFDRPGAARPLRRGLAGNRAGAGLGVHQLSRSLAENPNMTGADLGNVIVDSYIEDDQRIVDDQARAEFAGARGLRRPPADHWRSSWADITLTAVDLARVPPLMDSVNSLVYRACRRNQRAVAKARSYAQTFTSIFGSNVPPSYIDLGNFVALLNATPDDAGVEQADNVLAARRRRHLREARPASPAPAASRSTSPTHSSTATPSPVRSPTRPSPTASPDRLWDEFLAFHYTGRRFDDRSAGRGAGAEVKRRLQAHRGLADPVVQPRGRPRPAGAPERRHQRRECRLRQAPGGLSTIRRPTRST